MFYEYLSNFTKEKLRYTHTDAHMAQLTIIYLGVFSESVFAVQTAEVVQLTS